MSQAASQAATFYREVAASGRVWTIRDAAGFPAPRNGSGVRSMPFWSSRSRAEKIIKTVPAYEGFEPFELTLIEFMDTWLVGLVKDQFQVGLNWSGARATGYDIEPSRVRQILAR